MYSRYFKTGVENPSEEWHFSGISYALPPQTLTGNPWGKYENNVEEAAQLALPLSADKFPALTSCSTVYTVSHKNNSPASAYSQVQKQVL